MVAYHKRKTKQLPSSPVGAEMISDAILRKYKAVIVKLKKGELLFHQGDQALNFLIVRSGTVKMVNYNEEGREFVQGYFTDGQSFGEPPLFNHLPYPASAVAVTDSEVWKCPFDVFKELLRENFDLHLKLTQVLSGRLIYKSIMLTEIAVEEAEHRLRTLIEYFLKNEKHLKQGQLFKVPFTRQQLADMTGLRVETVIRTIKRMEQKNMLSLGDKGKIFWNITNITRKEKRHARHS